MSSADFPESTRDEWSDDEIVRRVIDGDVALFELVMRRYNQRLFRLARSIVGDEDEAEDVVQEAYVRAFQNLRQFAGRSSFATWLTKIAVHEALARRRKQRRVSLVDPSRDDSMAIHSHDRDAADDASQAELRMVLTSAVDELPTDLRAVFALRMVERLSKEDTADCLEITPANVKVRLRRARLQLRELIDQRIGRESRELYMFAGERCDRIVANVMARLSGS